MPSETRIPITNVDFATGDPMMTQSTIQLIDQHLAEFKEALAKHVAIQFQHQGQLLEETRRDLEAAKRELAEVKCEREAYKEAYRSAESDRRDLEETVKREKQALKDEIRELMERGAYGREEGSNPKNKA